MNPKKLVTIVRGFLQTGTLDTSLITKEEKYYSGLSIVTFKRILLERINNIIKKLDNTDIQVIRLNILGRVLSFPLLDEYFALLEHDKRPLELEKPLTERWYWNND
jgi:hypothetical protein